MAYNEELASRIRKALAGTKNLEEKKMFGGVGFMVNDKLCLGVHKNELMLRCEPEQTDGLLKKKGVKIFDISGKPMKGWLLISPEATDNKKDFDRWVKIALEANKGIATTGKKKK